MLFNYKIEENQSVVTVQLEGELIDRNQASELNKRVEALLEEDKHKFVLDLSELKYMNSSGLNILIQLLSKARSKGGEAIICGVNKKVEELLIITKLHTLFTIVPTQEDALKKLLNS